MGKIDIKDTLQKKFDAPVEDFHERRIVFWEDSQGSYDSYVNTLSLENVAIRKQTKSNQFVLKKELLIDHPKENYLIYRSFSPVGEENWLEDIEIYSEAFRADFISNLMEECQRAEYPSLRSSFQKYEKFFKGQKRKEAFLRFASQVQSPEKMDMAILAVLTGSDRLNFPSILFSLFSKGFAEEENEAYQNILRFGDVDAFWDMMQRATGYGSEERKLSDSFKTILVSAVGYDIHDTLWPRKYPTFYQEETGEYCSALIRAFFQEEKMRNSEALSSLIMEAEEELSFASVLEELSFASLIQSDVFPSFDYRLLKEICERLSKDCIQPEEVRDLLEKRKNSHWYFKVHDIVEALIPAVCFFEEEKKETFQMKGMTEVFNAYRDRLYRYDTYYRHFHQKDKAVRNTIPPQLEDSYKDVEDALEKQYKNDFLKKLSDQWLLWSKEALMQEGKIPSAIDQTHFYEREVEKKINSRTLTAILISDGLRYEVARELHDRLSGTDKAQVTIEGMEGVFPSITTFGMAALLPGRKTIGPNGEILVDNLPCGNLQQRRAILQKSCAQSDAILVKDFLGWKTIERQAFLKGKSLVYFYHDEIDNAGEHGLDVFSACEDAIQTLEKTIQTISDIRKGATILVTSDHGFLYNASPLDETEKAWREQFPEDAVISRRYVYRKGNLTSSYLLPVRMTINDEEESYHGFSPQDVVRIRMGGKGENYVHGGISLEETMIPLLTYRLTSKEGIYDTRLADYEITNTSHKTTMAFAKVGFYQKEKVGEKVLPRTLLVSFVDRKGEAISTIQEVHLDRRDEEDARRIVSVTLSLMTSKIHNGDSYFLTIKDKETKAVIDTIPWSITILDTGFDF